MFIRITVFSLALLLSGCESNNATYSQSLCPDVKPLLGNLDIVVYQNSTKNKMTQNRGIKPKSFMERLADVDVMFAGGIPVAVYNPGAAEAPGEELKFSADSNANDILGGLVKSNLERANWVEVNEVVSLPSFQLEEREAAFKTSNANVVMFIEYYYELVNSRAIYLNAKVSLHPRKVNFKEEYLFDARSVGQLKQNKTLYRKSLFVSSQMLDKSVEQAQAIEVVMKDDYLLLRETVADSYVQLSALITQNLEQGICL
ncbi:hypothetical protein ACFSJ3_11390 [Corallincola platygyrae]|uniref:Uncharacterized protein n=1 Tax=Corallincola platygyrae TaxID=1193278 RepID=A0ABW4XN98_9GAMM